MTTSPDAADARRDVADAAHRARDLRGSLLLAPQPNRLLGGIAGLCVLDLILPVVLLIRA